MIQASTLQFLRDLALNNDRDWFADHKRQYEQARKDASQFFDAVIRRLSDHQPSLAGLTAKDCMFRIYRDTRFSNNKLPYKTAMGAFMAPGGRKSMHPGYYIHLEPGKGFAGGGLWMPPAPLLKAVRQEIDYNWKEFSGLLGDSTFTRVYGSLEGEQLSRPPKGYAADHPGINELKRKSWVGSRPISDAEWTSPHAVDHVADILLALRPVITFLDTPLHDEEVQEALSKLKW
jgi:uncharacterized protein (TIGR02453 family)